MKWFLNGNRVIYYINQHPQQVVSVGLSIGDGYQKQPVGGSWNHLECSLEVPKYLKSFKKKPQLLESCELLDRFLLLKHRKDERFLFQFFWVQRVEWEKQLQKDKG